jgi:hypothetical protein
MTCCGISVLPPACVPLTGSLRSLLLMKRSRCFWCMQALWWMCVSTLRTL